MTFYPKPPTTFDANSASGLLISGSTSGYSYINNVSITDETLSPAIKKRKSTSIGMWFRHIFQNGADLSIH
jgi:hypothetical protein